MNTLQPDTGLAYAFVNEAPNYSRRRGCLDSAGDGRLRGNTRSALVPCQGRLQRGQLVAVGP